MSKTTSTLARIAATLLFAALPVYCFCRMLSTTHQFEVVCWGVLLFGSLYLFGLVSALIYSGPCATTLVDFLLYPKRYLKKAPPILSRQQGLIARGYFAEAEVELIELRRNHKGSAEIALMLADLHAGEFRDLEAAVADCLFYFRHRAWRYHELNLPLLLRFADWQHQLGRMEAACTMLTKEVRTSIYPEAEKKALLARLNSLREQCSKE